MNEENIRAGKKLRENEAEGGKEKRKKGKKEKMKKIFEMKK
jgi:hypothetical protein